MPSLLNQDDPDRIALIVDGGTTLAYGALDRAVASVAARLSPRQLVFLIGDNDLPTLLAYLACLSAGAVPLLLGAGLKASQIAALVCAYDPHQVFGPQSIIDTIDTIDTIANIGTVADLGGAANDAGANLAVEPVPDSDYVWLSRTTAEASNVHPDLALLLATSGSTGSPKLVRLTFANLTANARSIARYLDIGPAERAITSLPLNYSFGLSIVNSHLISGASLVLTQRSLMDPQFWALMANHSVTSLSGVPYSYDILLKGGSIPPSWRKFRRCVQKKVGAFSRCTGKPKPLPALPICHPKT